MSPTVIIVLLWLGFGASHMLLSSQRFRPKLVGALGERAFQGVYSLVALALFVPLVWIYFEHRHEGAWLWMLPATPIVSWTVQGLITVGVLLAVAGLVSPSPTSLTGGGTEVRGVHRITRHPLLMGFGWIGLFHLPLNASATDVAFFAGLPIFAVVGCRHQERRLLATRGPEFRAYVEATPFLPFNGRDTLQGLREIPVALWVGGLATAAVLRWLHF